MYVQGLVPRPQPAPVAAPTPTTSNAATTQEPVPLVTQDLAAAIITSHADTIQEPITTADNTFDLDTEQATEPPAASSEMPSPTSAPDKEMKPWTPEPKRGIRIIKVYKTEVPVNDELSDSSEDDEEGEEDEEKYYPQWLGALGKRGKTYFVNVKWAGYDCSENTWEPLANLSKVTLDEYWAEHGTPVEQERKADEERAAKRQRRR